MAADRNIPVPDLGAAAQEGNVMARKYRKKPVVIEAIQWDGLAETANAFIGEGYDSDWWYETAESKAIVIPTPEGEMTAQVGDWIIKGVTGEIYPCKPDLFDATYEALDE